MYNYTHPDTVFTGLQMETSMEELFLSVFIDTVTIGCVYWSALCLTVIKERYAES